MTADEKKRVVLKEHSLLAMIQPEAFTYYTVAGRDFARISHGVNIELEYGAFVVSSAQRSYISQLLGLLVSKSIDITVLGVPVAFDVSKLQHLQDNYGLCYLRVPYFFQQMDKNESDNIED